MSLVHHAKRIVKRLLPPAMLQFIQRLKYNDERIASRRRIQAFRSFKRAMRRKERHLDVFFDTNNACNLKCIFCDRQWPEIETDDTFIATIVERNKQRPVIMTVQEFERIAEQLFPFTKHLALSCATEPTLTKRFPEMLTITSRFKIPHVMFATNGVLFSEELMDATIRCGVHDVRFSVSGGHAESYQRIMGGDHFDRVMQNIRRMKELKERAGSSLPSLTLSFVVFAGNEAEPLGLVDRYGDTFDVLRLVNVIEYGHKFQGVRLGSSVEFPYMDLKGLSGEEFAALESAILPLCEKRGVVLQSPGCRSAATKNDHIAGCCLRALTYRQVSSNGDLFACSKEKIGNLLTDDYRNLLRSGTLINELFQMERNHCGICRFH